MFDHERTADAHHTALFFRQRLPGKLMRRLDVAATTALCALPAAARAADVSITVVANFAEPAKRLATTFQAKTGDTIVISTGALGQLLTQTTQDAPYEIFLSADAARPQKLAQMGFADPMNLFTYAVGKLVLFSAKLAYVDAQGKVLATGNYTHIAIADPKSAPYGAAALETLKQLGLYAAVAPKIVTAKDITQAYQFTATGNAELGFVALSQVGKAQGGSQWLVPQKDYKPILQDAVLLKPSEGDSAARAFLAYLRSPEALTVIRSYDYATAP